MSKNPTRKPFNGANLVPGNPGNSGGKKGRSGRKALEFKVECSRLTDEQVLSKVGEYLTASPVGPADPTWRWCAEYVSGYSKTKPTQALEVSGKDGVPLAVTYRIASASGDIVEQG